MILKYENLKVDEQAKRHGPLKTFRQLHISQRRIIEKMHHEGSSMAAIARAIGVHRSTVKKEVDRNSTNGYYKAEMAEVKALGRKYVAGRKANKLWHLVIAAEAGQQTLKIRRHKRGKEILRIYKRFNWKVVKDFRRFRKERNRKPLPYYKQEWRKEYLKKRLRDLEWEGFRRLHRFPEFWLRYEKFWSYKQRATADSKYTRYKRFRLPERFRFAAEKKYFYKYSSSNSKFKNTTSKYKYSRLWPLRYPAVFAKPGTSMHAQKLQSLTQRKPGVRPFSHGLSKSTSFVFPGIAMLRQKPYNWAVRLPEQSESVRVHSKKIEHIPQLAQAFLCPEGKRSLIEKSRRSLIEFSCSLTSLFNSQPGTKISLSRFF